MITNIGLHKVQHGDIMNNIDKLMTHEIADFVYSDPPWGEGNLKYWQTMNFKNNNQPRNESINYAEFLPYLFKLIHRYSKDLIIIEYGIKWREDIIKIAQHSGYIHGGFANSFYKSGSKMLPLDIHIFSKTGNYQLTDKFTEVCKDNHGLNLVQKIFKLLCPQDSKIVLDPMCGMGYTAQCAIDNKLIFRGNELNKKRLDKTIQRIKASQ